ncbi:hypothetical protein K439DRAFT_1628818 [Ramaria rubella]|nr:hypothetical protein K439DRAFT_1628818 [Ramaria rubella]
MPTGKKLGTLIVVVLKARHLKDSHTFYKQDPYALIRLGGTGKQTKVDPRGGQHPVWDEELHLPVLEASGMDGRMLKVSAYSKESKTDELIGEGKVDISETLKKGEFDDWVKLELNGAYRGEIYLEMTYYSADPPLARRPSKLSPNDRLWRPPATPPKDRTSPYLSPQRSPQIRPIDNANSSARIPPSLSPGMLPSTSQPRSASASSVNQHSQDSAPTPSVPTAATSPPRQPFVDPTLKNIPFLDVGPPAAGPNMSKATPAPALYAVPSILRPRNVKSSPIPVPVRDNAPPPPPKEDLNDPHRRFQRELAESDAAFAARLAQSEGIDVGRLRAEEADAELARKLALEDEDATSLPGAWPV